MPRINRSYKNYNRMGAYNRRTTFPISQGQRIQIEQLNRDITETIDTMDRWDIVLSKSLRIGSMYSTISSAKRRSNFTYNFAALHILELQLWQKRLSNKIDADFM